MNMRVGTSLITKAAVTNKSSSSHGKCLLIYQSAWFVRIFAFYRWASKVEWRTSSRSHEAFHSIETWIGFRVQGRTLLQTTSHCVPKYFLFGHRLLVSVPGSLARPTLKSTSIVHRVVIKRANNVASSSGYMGFYGRGNVILELAVSSASSSRWRPSLQRAYTTITHKGALSASDAVAE